MGLDLDLLVPLLVPVEPGGTGVWRDGVLAVLVSTMRLVDILCTDPTRIKVLALIAFFILAICISAGGVGPGPIGFKYWSDPGAFADSINGVAKTFVVAGTLYAGTEMYVDCP